MFRVSLPRVREKIDLTSSFIGTLRGDGCNVTTRNYWVLITVLSTLHTKSHFFQLFCIDFNSLQYNLFFRVVLGSQQNWMEGAEMSVYALPLHMHSHPHYPHAPQGGMFVTINEPTLTHQNYPKFIEIV